MFESHPHELTRLKSCGEVSVRTPEDLNPED